MGRTTRTYHPETHAVRVDVTVDDAVCRRVADLRINSDDLWAAVHARIAERAAVTAAKGNPRSAQRRRKLLTGLLFCGYCGAPYIVVGRNRYGCREARKKMCDNRTLISGHQLEDRIPGVIKDGLMTEEIEARFNAALASERGKSDHDPQAVLKGLQDKRFKHERVLENLMLAIENGAPYERFQARIAQEEADLASLNE